MDILIAGDVFPWVSFVLGLVLGSFYNVCVYRWITEQSVVSPGSHCPNCGKPIHAWENIPVLSYILLRGRCSGCKESIGFRYPAMELISGAWAWLLANQVGFGWAWFLLMVIGGLWLISAFIDMDTYLLPDVFTYSAAIIAIPGAIFVLGLPITDVLMGALIGAGMFLLIQIFYRFVRKREGLGTGDIKLMLSIGAVTGWQGLPLVVLLGSASGLVIGLGLAVVSRNKVSTTMIPFGPFLVLGGMATILYAPQIWNAISV